MDYPFENLDPETFQQFCQALLASEVPNLQCFPVAQPDGGRDAVAHIEAAGTLDFAMYQVKYVRRPQAQSDAHRWLVDVVNQEAPKIVTQIPKGARKFYLLTNVAGTAHPDVGSIDVVQSILADVIPIPSEVWWRDDISRRLDNRWNLKWVYSQLMTGPDLMRALIESGLSEDRERRSTAVKSFVADQYGIDEEVKFKQVELQNRLLDLFIDVPVIAPTPPPGKRYHRRMFLYNRLAAKALQRGGLQRGDVFAGHFFAEQQLRIGAATMLLDADVQEEMPFVVLEGAPGQGKSTISQYVAQVHRMRLLGKHRELEAIPEHHRTSPLRLPFKVDLRDLATWLARRDPFTPDGDEGPPDGWQKSLESFLAALVRHHSGGAQFSVADLHAVVRCSAVLLLLDGLDEVADIARREEVVHEVLKGTRRLREVAVGVQAVVTSRPAAFANSPGLPEDEFSYLQLDAVTRSLIDEYAQKWLRARRLQGKERSDVLRILKEKLDQPHLRDLARNPMQLAILLSLIHTRGSSLPDKRTSLYDSYMELFFNREAEKSDVVREHRDLLVSIHQYVAWTLQAQAEEAGASGAIKSDALEGLVRRFLTQEHHEPELASALFRGMVERVVALVSRVEGTFEFEVQPLREYFAARYLYETAPYSPPGNERCGTKPDRFDALARDFYWLNVTRFYAGCYSKGELPSLVDRLDELVRDDQYRRLAHPRMLAATLLSDWVFAQHPKSMREVVKLVLDRIGLRFLISSAGRRRWRGSATITLPSRSGREQLVERCFQLLRTGAPQDLAFDVIEMLQANAMPEELAQQWERETLATSPALRGTWLAYGVRMGVLGRVQEDVIRTVLAGSPLDTSRIVALVGARRWNILESDPEIFSATVNAVLNRQVESFQNSGGTQRLLERFMNVMVPFRYGSALMSPEPVALHDLWRRHGLAWPSDKPDLVVATECAVAENCRRVVLTAEELANGLGRTWATELEPWNRLTEVVRGELGSCWLTNEFALLAAGIRSSAEKGAHCDDLLDGGVPLCSRARYARLRAGAPLWWERQGAEIASELDAGLWAALLLSWASVTTLQARVDQVSNVLESLSADSWRTVFRSVERCMSLTRGSSGDRLVNFDSSALPKRLGGRAAAALTLRAQRESRSELANKYLFGKILADPVVLEVSQVRAVEHLLRGDKAEHLLSVIRGSYAAGAVCDEYVADSLAHVETPRLAAAVAQTITDSPEDYPGYLLALAEGVCQAETAKYVQPVGRVAERDSWTFS